MEKKNELIRIIVFVTLLIFTVSKFDKFLSNPIGTYWATQTGMAEASIHKEAYDVCFLGTSTVISNVSNQELYEKYGIAGVSVGEPQQPIYLAYYTLEDFLTYQSPQVVFLDTKALFYGDDWVRQLTEQEDYIVHSSIDAIKSPMIKRKALHEVNQYKAIEVGKWNYYSNLYYSHENWKKITQRNFKNHEMLDCINGNISAFDFCEDVDNTYDTSDADNKLMIDEKAEKYFSKMVDICKKENATLVLITGYTYFNKSEHNAMSELAQKYNVSYIDINEHIEDIGFEHKIDIHEGAHFNLSGSIKWTDYLGDYLIQNYDFTDRRNDSSYDWYKNQSEIFNQQKDMVTEKRELLSAVTFDEYLIALKGLNQTNNAIFISVFDEASACLTEAEKIMLHDLGLLHDLTGKYRYSYVAVIYGNTVEEEISPDETVIIEGNINDNDYKVASGGMTSGIGNASILINKKEYMQMRRGFNIVVYNTKLKELPV